MAPPRHARSGGHREEAIADEAEYLKAVWLESLGGFANDFRPNLTPTPFYNDGARPAVPVATKLSPADQFKEHCVAPKNFGQTAFKYPTEIPPNTNYIAERPLGTKIWDPVNQLISRIIKVIAKISGLYKGGHDHTIDI
jgi:hypothetical protein